MPINFNALKLKTNPGQEQIKVENVLRLMLMQNVPAALIQQRMSEYPEAMVQNAIANLESKGIIDPIPAPGNPNAEPQP